MTVAAGAAGAVVTSNCSTLQIPTLRDQEGIKQQERASSR